MPKINAKMPTTTKNAEMNKIVKNWKKQPPEVFSKKSVLENFAKLTEKDLCPSLTLIFY